MSDSISRLNSPITRRRALAVGGSIAGGLIAASTPLAALAGSIAPKGIYPMPFPQGAPQNNNNDSGLPVHEIEEIIGAQGTVSNGVLSIEVDRNELHVTGPHGIPFKPSWEINHEFFFQSIGDGNAIFNGDICVLPEESNATIDRIIGSGLTFMAFHQHFFELDPQVFFQHFRGVGDPLAIARAVRYVVAATSTRYPQPPPSTNTPLDPDRLAHILGGSAQVGGDGVVSVSIGRKENIYLGGHHIKTDLGVETTVAFEPLNGGSYCAVAPDFALIAKEVNPVFKRQRNQGFQIHCLYNQETDEQPQFYFSHNLKAGDAYQLAHEVRNSLNLTNSDFMS